MGDMDEEFRALREYTKTKRRNNTKSSTALLEASGVKFESKNGGSHLIVTTGHGLVDFWPSSGLWIPRKTHKRKGGVKNLIAFAKSIAPGGQDGQ